jgi:hypothetical protein
MTKRRRFKQTNTSKERLSTFAKNTRERASTMPAGPEKERLLKRARQADTASHIEEWVNSAGLQPPT